MSEPSANIEYYCSCCSAEQPGVKQAVSFNDVWHRKVGFPVGDGSHEWMWVKLANAEATGGVLVNEPVYVDWQLGDFVHFGEHEGVPVVQQM